MSLKIKGKFIHSEKLAGKTIEVNLIGDRRLAAAIRSIHFDKELSQDDL